MTIQSQSKWPEAVAIGAEGVSLAIAKMLRHKIVPCVPIIDIGYDLVSGYGSVVKRVQIKATTLINASRPESMRFSLSKHKAGLHRNGAYVPAQRRVYHPSDVDVFIFVHVRLKKFYVMPVAELDFRKHYITFNGKSPWADAWHVLKEA